MKSFKPWFTKFQAVVNQPRVEILLVLLTIIIILRLPNFAEPYWYGDEGIYLTIGNALRHGSRLYVDIVDHKTPLIYYLSMVPSQFAFRLLLLVWMLATTTFFYSLAWKWFKALWPTVIATVVFIVFTTLPWLEGNIPNGELFVMGFVLAGAHLLPTSWLSVERWQQRLKIKQLGLVVASGVLFGLGILTKVPAIFDVAAFLALGWFSAWYYLFSDKKNVLKILPKWLSFEVALILGAAVPIILSALYFVARGSGQAYLDFGLLYNFRYAGSWSMPFTNPILLAAFTLPGKVAITAVIGVALTLSTKWFKPLWPTLIMWTVLALFASTLSNRPYPHYFMQVIPPVALSLGYVASMVPSLISRRYKKSVLSLVPLLGTVGVLLLVAGVWLVLRFYPYSTVQYYSQFFKVMTGQISQTEYANSFNSLIAENEQVAALIKAHPDRYLLVWGTNPMLYALSGKQPVGRFTVAFHIKDFNAQEETLQALKEKNPYFVVVMEDDRSTFPELNVYLTKKYLPNTSFDHMTLWKRMEK